MLDIQIDGRKYQADADSLTGGQILGLADKSYPEWSLSLERDGKSVPVGKDEQIDLKDPGNRAFKTATNKPQRPHKGEKISIKVDGDEFEVAGSVMTGEQILALVGKNPDEWSLNEKLKSGRRIMVEKDREVDLTNPELDRFETAPLQAQQGA